MFKHVREKQVPAVHRANVMKGTENFKKTIQSYLSQRAKEDVLFAATFEKPGKNIEDCITYILNAVYSSGCNGFTDEETFAMAVHYYDEDNINIGRPITCNVVVNHKIELTEEEKRIARKDAVKRVQDEAMAKLTQPKKRVKKQVVNPPSLFD